MDVTEQIRKQSNLVYSASDNTNPSQLASAKSLNYSHGATLQKPENLGVSVVPYKINYKDTIGLFGVENYFLKVNCAVTGDIVLQCFTEVGWSCAYVEGMQLPTGTVTYYPPGGTGQQPVDTARFELRDAPGGGGNALSSTSQIAVGSTIYMHQTQTDPEGDPSTFVPFSWYFRDVANDPGEFTLITGETASSYTVDVSVFGKHVGCFVDYTDAGGNNDSWNAGTCFVATNGSALPEYQNSTVNQNAQDSQANFFSAALNSDTLPNIGADAYISVELIRKDSGNRFIDAHVDYRLYTQDGFEHPFDKMYIKPTDSFYIGIHGRNTKRLAYEFECKIGNEYRALSSIEDKSLIMNSVDRPSY